MSGKVPRERMAELRRGSKLRQRLQMEIEEASQSVQVTEDDLRYQYQQLSYVQSYELDPVKRQREISYWQSSIGQLEGQMSTLRHRLAIALQDLQDFEEATAEVTERANREEQK
ncbi:hypothetical protein PWT90_08527 [Aphanocladium album]|nr:hypothetical protein PWT90_08527 [Aphanocladium album]